MLTTCLKGFVTMKSLRTTVLGSYFLFVTTKYAFNSVLCHNSQTMNIMGNHNASNYFVFKLEITQLRNNLLYKVTKTYQEIFDFNEIKFAKAKQNRRHLIDAAVKISNKMFF